MFCFICNKTKLVVTKREATKKLLRSSNQAANHPVLNSSISSDGLIS